MRLLTLLLLAVFGSAAHAIDPIEEFDGITPLSDFQLLRPDIAQQAMRSDGDVVLTLDGWGEQFRLILDDNDRLVERIPQARQAAIRASGDRFLSGTVKGKPGSWARINYIDGQLGGAFFDGNELYIIDKATGFSMPPGRSINASATIMMRFSDMQLDTLVDHGGELPGGGNSRAAKVPEDYRSFVSDLRESVRTSGLTLLSMPVTIVGDTEFKDDHGANAESVVIGRINFVDGIFSNQLGVGIILWHYEQLNNNGPLTSTDSSVLLTNQFRSYMRTGDGSSLPFAGLAHLFSGKNFDGSTVGRAYLNVLCSTSAGYGINQNLSSDTTSSLVFAHELGHNYSANHTDAGIMQARISSSREFAPDSVDVMAAAVSRASCLVDGGLRIFEDGFE